jgi:pilus assembly protein Flp/PilA
MDSLFSLVKHFLVSEDGPTAVEYAVMLGLIIVVCVSVVGSLGLNTKAVCDTICTALGR